jgi:hypothetical protein
MEGREGDKTKTYQDQSQEARSCGLNTNEADLGSCPKAEYCISKVEALGCLIHFAVTNTVTVLFILTLVAPTNCTFS